MGYLKICNFSATYAEVCYRNDPTRDLNECLKGSIQTLIKKISGGMCYISQCLVSTVYMVT